MNTSTINRQDTVEHAPLRAADRCDYCGARAWVRVTLRSGQLLFCAHHAREHMDALKAQALDIQDERAQMVDEES